MKTTTPQTADKLSSDEAWREQMSALMDGELSADEIDACLDAMEQHPDWRQQWAQHQLVGELMVRHSRSPSAPVVAANDAVFWRRFAVAASVVASVAVAWGTWDAGSSSGPVLAKSEPPLWVAQTASGPIMRDPLLEELLQQHREQGSGGAWQNTTGFLRNATLDTTR